MLLSYRHEGQEIVEIPRNSIARRHIDCVDSSGHAICNKPAKLWFACVRCNPAIRIYCADFISAAPCQNRASLDLKILSEFGIG